MPSGLESIWTYVDPSTMQGVSAGIVVAFVAFLLPLVYAACERSGIRTALGPAKKALAERHGLKEVRRGFLSSLRFKSRDSKRSVRLVIGTRKGRLNCVLSWKAGGGRFRRECLLSELDEGLDAWIGEEMSRGESGV